MNTLRIKRIALACAGLLLLALVVIAVRTALTPNTQPATVTSDTQSETLVASIIPETEAAAELGAYNLKACELFVDTYNQAHKGQRKLTFVHQDSKSTPKDGVNALQAILVSGKPLVCQVHLSAVAVAVAPILAEKKIPMIYVGGTAEPKTLSPYAVRNYPDPVALARESVDAFVKDKLNGRVGILRVNDEFGLALASAFTNRLAEVNLLPVIQEAYDRSSSDFRASVAKVVEANPTDLYLIGYGNSLGRIIAQLREMGYRGQICGSPEIQFSDVLSTAGEAAEGVRFLDLGFDSESPAEPTATFVRAYRARYGKSPSAVSAVVYDAWSLIMQAYDSSGTTDPDRFISAMTTIKDYPGVSGKISVSKDRDIIYPLTPKVICQGRPQKVK